MIRVISIALAFVALTLALLPFQLIGMIFDLRLQRTIPHLYHRILCALIGVRIREVGTRSAASPALILSNHVSWLDICVITALGPVVFVAKSEVAGWPVFGWLARLQCVMECAPMETRGSSANSFSSSQDMQSSRQIAASSTP